MPLVRQILLALRTLAEEEDRNSRRRSRRNSNSGRNKNRGRQTTSLVITFRDLFSSGSLNLILEDLDACRRSCRKTKTMTTPDQNSQLPALSVTSPFPENHHTNAAASSRDMIPCRDEVVVTSGLPQRLQFSEETVPLLQDESSLMDPSCTSLVPVPLPLLDNNIFDRVLSSMWRKKEIDLTVPLTTDDENKTVETLRKVLKWSPRRRNMACFTVPLPTEGEYKSFAVVQNAVNRVKEEQELKKKKRRFFRLTFC